MIERARTALRPYDDDGVVRFLPMEHGGVRSRAPVPGRRLLIAVSTSLNETVIYVPPGRNMQESNTAGYQ
jgi:hypothetical protein